MSLVFTVGIHSSKIPLNAKTLSVAGFGAASDFNLWINPASLAENEGTYFEFSGNPWLQEVDGSYMSYVSDNQKLSFHTWGVENLEEYGDSPSDAPLGFFGSKIIFASYAKGFSKGKHHFGFNIDYTYMTLLEIDDKGFTADFGYKVNLGKFNTLGLAIKNLACDFKSGDNLAQMIVIGSRQDLKGLPLSIYLDIYHDENKGSGSFQGFIFKNKLFNIVGGLKYSHKLETLDTSLGFNILWGDIEFSIGTLIKDDDSIGTPIFYQMSYNL